MVGVPPNERAYKEYVAQLKQKKQNPISLGLPSRLRDSQFFDGATKSIVPSCFIYACRLQEVGESIYVITINTDYHGEIKAREAEGYAYEGADASLELLARRRLGAVPSFFRVEGFRVNVERRHNALGQLVTVSEAVVKVKIGDEVRMSVAEGNGPVNALDLALRKDLGELSPLIDDLELVDYKVRILNGGTGAVTRVLIESRDGPGDRWFTVGVSPNIVDASFEALLDALTYKLLKANGAAEAAVASATEPAPAAPAPDVALEAPPAEEEAPADEAQPRATGLCGNGLFAVLPVLLLGLTGRRARTRTRVSS